MSGADVRRTARFEAPPACERTDEQQERSRKTCAGGCLPAWKVGEFLPDGGEQ